MKNLEQEDYRKNLKKDNSVLIDVRTPEEWNEGIIEGAKLINIMDPGFQDQIKKLEKNKNYYIYCRSGSRSARACQILESHGFSNTFNLVGGINNWKGEQVNP
jgi:rhodanese-related sulfurtransferase